MMPFSRSLDVGLIKGKGAREHITFDIIEKGFFSSHHLGHGRLGVISQTAIFIYIEFNCIKYISKKRV